MSTLASWLILEEPDGGAGRSWALSSDEVLIGRLLDLGVPLEGDGVSRRHARIAPAGSGFTIEDLGSRNGTQVDGEPIPPHAPQPLRHDAVITVGGHRLRYRHADGSVRHRLVTTALMAETRSGRRSDPRLQLLLVLGDALRGSPGPDAVLARIAACVEGLVGASAVFVGLFEAEGDGLRRSASRRSGAATDSAPPQEAVAHGALHSGEALVVEQGGSAALLVPFGAGPGGRGLIWAASAEGATFEEDALALVSFVGVFCANAVRVAEGADRHRRRADALEPRFASGRGKDPMAEVEARVALIAKAHCPVLFLGETGTGKTTLARALHRQSPRCDGPFIALNCAAIPAALLEAELFGYGPRSGIAGADPRGRPGAFEQAEGGTLFFDELGDMPLSQQAKLLTAIESRRIRRLGAGHEVTVDVRITAATSCELKADVAGGRFRADLYHRLARAVVELPPLRARLTELPRLVDAALTRLRDEIPSGIKRVSDDAMSRLRAYPWPGNLRELENALAHALLTGASGEVITCEQLPPHIAWGEPSHGPLIRIVRDPSTLTQMERAKRDVLIAAIQEAGSLTRAAKQLGYSKQWAITLARRYGVQVRHNQ